MMTRVISKFLILVSSALLLFGKGEAKRIKALKTATPIQVDGILSEPVWDRAPEAVDFIQFEPERGEPASMRTVARILYDDRFMYIGFLCYDPQPEKIAARITKRDADPQQGSEKKEPRATLSS